MVVGGGLEVAGVAEHKEGCFSITTIDTFEIKGPVLARHK